MRTIVAHVYRLLAADLAPTTLQEGAPLRIKITDWIIDTLKYLQAGIAGKLCQAALVTYACHLPAGLLPYYGLCNKLKACNERQSKLERQSDTGG